MVEHLAFEAVGKTRLRTAFRTPLKTVIYFEVLLQDSGFGYPFFKITDYARHVPGVRYGSQMEYLEPPEDGIAGNMPTLLAWINNEFKTNFVGTTVFANGYYQVFASDCPFKLKLGHGNFEVI